MFLDWLIVFGLLIGLCLAIALVIFLINVLPVVGAILLILIFLGVLAAIIVDYDY